MTNLKQVEGSGTMFDVIYTEKVNVGSAVVERGNTVSVSQDYLEKLGRIKYCEVACTGATSDGFCVYVQENPDTATRKYKRNKKYKVISRSCGNKTDDEDKYVDTLNCVHYLAKAINSAYMNGENEFNVDDWLLANNYA